MRYAMAFLLAALCLTTGAIATFVHISSVSLVAAQPTSQPTADTIPGPVVETPVAPTAADYARYADADKLWRERHARQYSISELRARGDGKRTAREAMQDRVFMLTRRGDRAGAIVELEHWVQDHPRDKQALLSLARLLNEVGRASDAVARYREILALHDRAN